MHDGQRRPPILTRSLVHLRKIKDGPILLFPLNSQQHNTRYHTIVRVERLRRSGTHCSNPGDSLSSSYSGHRPPHKTQRFRRALGGICAHFSLFIQYVLSNLSSRTVSMAALSTTRPLTRLHGPGLINTALDSTTRPWPPSSIRTKQVFRIWSLNFVFLSKNLALHAAILVVIFHSSLVTLRRIPR